MEAAGCAVEDVASKLMLTIAFEPLLMRLRYVTARVGSSVLQVGVLQGGEG